MEKIEKIKKQKTAKNAKDLVDAMSSERCFHKALDKLIKRLAAHEDVGERSNMKFGIRCNGDSNPVFRAGILKSDGFSEFCLKCIMKNGIVISGERSIAVWNLSRMYDCSPIVFKSYSYMNLEDYAFWMRKPVAEVERMFCREVFSALMAYIKHDPMWRIWTGLDGWIEIDPWKFAVEVDLGS